MNLLEPLFRWDAVESALSDRARVQGMLDFEAALAQAEARTGVIPSRAAPAIAAACRAELFDLPGLARAAALAGNLAIPTVEQLTALVGADDREAAGYVHWGATSQDALDTGLALQLRAALESIAGELERLADAAARIADEHRATPAAARTWMQQALPTTFGMKAAAWVDALDRHRVRLAQLRREALVVQFGGAAGTLAALGDQGPAVAAALAEQLRLGAPAIPWHTQRDRFVEVATTLGLCTGTLGKIARDIALWAQTEVAEVSEPPAAGRGASSTLPHKRNPVASAVVLAAAVRLPGLVSAMLGAMLQEEQRGLGGWHAEWETLPAIVSLSAGALHHLTEAVRGLEIDPGRMRRNLELTRGLVFAEAVQMALGAHLGLAGSHERMQAACARALAEQRPLRDVLASDAAISPWLSQARLDQLFDPAHYLGASSRMIDDVLAAHAALGRSGVRRED